MNETTFNIPKSSSLIHEPFFTKGQWLTLALLITGISLTIFTAIALFSFCPYSIPFLSHFFAPLTLKGSIAIGFAAVVVTFIGSVTFFVMTKKREDEAFFERDLKKNEIRNSVSFGKPTSSFEPPSSLNNLEDTLKRTSLETPALTVSDPVGRKRPKLDLMVQVKEGRCNLEKPGQDVAALAFKYNREQMHFIQTPQMGIYSPDGYLIDNSELTVRLAPEQIQRLPESVKEAFKEEKPTDFFFMIFSPSIDTQGRLPIRNLSLHTMAIPEYDMILGLKTFPKDLPNVDTDSRKKKLDDVDVYADIGLWEVQGLKEPPQMIRTKIKDEMSTEYLQIGNNPSQDICIHKTCLSPDNCAITLDNSQDASSFILTAKFRQKRVVLAAIYLKESSDISYDGKNMQTIYEHLKTQTWFPNCKWLPDLFEE